MPAGAAGAWDSVTAFTLGDVGLASESAGERFEYGSLLAQTIHEGVPAAWSCPACRSGSSSRSRWPWGRIYAATLAVAYVVTFVLGLLVYPRFRYHVRALFLDRYEPWASNLFDTKENFAALGLPIATMLLVMSRAMDAREDRLLVFI